jgi:hypothetical protein
MRARGTHHPCRDHGKPRPHPLMRRHGREISDRGQLAQRHVRPKLAGQLLWPDVPEGSSFGTHPAAEINLHLDHICAVQRGPSVASGYAFRGLDRGTNLRPR